MKQLSKTYVAFLFILLATLSSVSEVSYGYIPRYASRGSAPVWAYRSYSDPSTRVCKDTRSDCEAIVGSFPSNFVCETYRGQCDRWCGFCSQVGALQRCSDVFPVSRCLFALKTLQCRRNENIGRCRKTCCDCDDYHRNCV
ncbi:uncharacterized protein [Acropora muricata]|uniref:uncharacterized protein isoform X2 n=1 Tax=Acropora muricata TaxID=159855 RepID=UPI0034E61537